MTNISLIPQDRISNLQNDLLFLEEEIQKLKIDISKTISTGTIVASLATQMNGYLLCDGLSYSKNEYINLFNVIEYKFGGSGDNFNVPDYRGLFLQMVSNNQQIGTKIEAGLPNITGTARDVTSNSDTSQIATGAFYPLQNIEGGRGGTYNGTNGSTSYWRTGFSASRSSSIYGKSNTVQPPSSLVNYFIKF